MKNVRRLYAPLGYFIIAFLFFYISEMLCGYFVGLELRTGYDNTPYRKEAIMFLLSAQETDFIDLTEMAEDDFMTGCAVLCYDEESYKMNEVIYCAQDVTNIHGTSTISFCSGKMVAVAGMDSGYNIGDVVMVDETAFAVEGVLERHISAAINTGVFYSYCDLSCVPTQEVYVLTAKDGKRIADAYTKLEELVESKGAEMRSREMSRASFSDYVHYRGKIILLLGVLGIFYVGLVYLFAYIWLMLKKAEIQVLRMLGDLHIRRKVWVEYFAVWLSAFILSLMIFYVSSRGLCYSIAPIFDTLCVLLIIILLNGYILLKI